MATSLYIGLLVAVFAVYVEGLSSTGRNVCRHTRVERYTANQRYKTKCGFLGWKRCTRSRVVTRTRTATDYRCCASWVSRDNVHCDKAICFGQPAGACPNGGTCTRPGVCRCRPGFSGSRCADINECSSRNGGCGHKCLNTHGSYRCVCNTGFGLLSDKKNCKPVCFKQSPGQCSNGGTCTSPGRCSCRSGFSQPMCADINECAVGNGGCSQLCDNLPGSFRCRCGRGFGMLADKKTCKPVCHGSPPGQCPNRGTCVSPGICTCPSGFSAPKCDDINECGTNNNGGCNQICNNSPGSYSCGCEKGYGLIDARTCKPVCFGGRPGTCPNGGRCLSPDRCSCKKGFSGSPCVDVNECSIRNGGCSQLCQNNEGSYQCTCKEGYSLAEDGNSCKAVCNGLEPGTCPNGGTCSQPDICECAVGYSLPNCDDLDECESLNGGCSQQCENLPGSFRCICSSGYRLGDNEKSCSDIDECAEGTSGCSNFCVNRPGGFNCDCPLGFRLETDGKTCVDVNECRSKNGGCGQICVNSEGSFKCDCETGFALDSDKQTCRDTSDCGDRRFVWCWPECTQRTADCECPAGHIPHADGVHCVDPCFNEPCQHEGVCSKPSPESTTFSCDCTDTGYRGDNCEIGVVTLPASIRVRAGEQSDNVILTAFPEQELIISAVVSDQVQVFPSRMFLRHPTTSVSFKVIAKESGKYSLKFEFSGQDSAAFPNVPTLNVIADDVFSKYNIPLKGLPQGSFFVDVSLNNYDYKFTSTSQWYQLNSNPGVYFTKGVTFSSVGNVSMPLSVTGLEVTVTDRLNIGPVSSLRNPGAGSIITGLVTRTKRQAPFQLSVQDINDFISQNSILSTVFNLLQPLLPSWIQFLLNQNSPQPFFFAQILPGSSVQQLTHCSGAPLFDNTMYHTFRFTHAIILSVLGQHVQMPALESEEYCIILDLNKDYGTTFVFMFPRKVAEILKRIAVFEKLQNETGIVVYPRGFGLSLFRKLNVRPIGSELEFWNGDETFKYPLSDTATFWASLEVEKPAKQESDIIIHPSRLEAYISLPDIRKILTHIFIESWDLYIKGEASAIIPVKVFKKYFKIAIRSSVQSYGSFGGQEERTYCGPTANPPGIFAAVFVEGNLQLGLPVIQDLLLSADLEAYFFKRYDDVDINRVPSPIDLLKTLLEKIKEATGRLLAFIIQQLVNLVNVITPVIVSTIQTFQQHLQDLIQLVNQFLNGFNLALVQDFANLIQNIITSVNNLINQIRVLADQVSMMFESAVDELIDRARNETEIIKDTALDMAKLLYNETVGLFKGLQTWGIRGYFSITILGRKFGVEGEFVKSDAHIRRCGRFLEFFEHMNGEEAFRALGVLDGYPISLGSGENLWKFFSLRAGAGIEFALAQESSKFVVRIHARLNFFSARASADLIINNNGIHLATEANIFNIFRVRLTVSATVFVNIADWSLKVKGEFLPGGGRKRQAEKSLQSSLWNAVRNFVNRLGDEAVKRIRKIQDAFDKAKDKVSGAQRWLDKKKAEVDKANRAFDWVIDKLEVVKQKLEAAKGPFKRALDKLKAAQKRVDKLCKIRDCKPVCVPGLKFRWCKKGWFRYPCFKFTNCMFKIPNIFCHAGNLACRIVRGVAFLALEVAKIFVRIPMLALDLAKAAVTVAQIVVDKARVVLEAVKLLFDLAKFALEGVKLLFDAAKLALEVVKFAVRAAQFALNFIIKYGLQSILDVGACGFELELSTRDIFEFEVFCEVNPFRLGWKTVRFRLNFRNIISSIWNAAKSLVKNFMKSIENVIDRIGRRKRAIDYDVFNRLHKVIRLRRQTDNVTDSGTDFDQIFNNLNNGSILTNGSFVTDQEFWKAQCQTYDPIISFLRLGVEILRNVTGEMEIVMLELEDRKNENMDLLHTISTLTADDSEIDYDVALEDFNVSREEVIDAVNEANATLQEDELVKESKGAVEYSMQANREAADTVSNFKILPLWKEEMENVTLKAFASGDCSGFYDCVIWSFGQLYELFDSVDPTLILAAQEFLPQLEEIYYELFDNDTKSFIEIKNISNDMTDIMRIINADDIFCGTVPNITEGPDNATVLLGGSIKLNCRAESVPPPTYYWYKDGEIYITGKSLSSLTFGRVSVEDAGEYVCSAGNHIANGTSEPAFLSVVFPPKIVNLPKKLEVVIGDEIQVLCNATASPEPNIEWYATSESDVPMHGASLLLPAVQVSQSGMYKCEATNDYGSTVSNSMTLDVKAPKPDCPTLTFKLGYIVESLSRFDGNSTLLNETFLTGMPLKTAFMRALALITESAERKIIVQTRIQSSSLNLVIVEMSMDCSTTSICSAKTCEEQYKNMSAILNEALSMLRAVVQSDEALFVLDGGVYYFNPSQVDVSQESQACPKGYKKMKRHICVEIAQGSIGGKPKNFRISRTIRFGRIVIHVIRWDPPSRFEASKTRYVVSISRRGSVPFVYRSSRPVLYVFLTTTDAVTTVRVRTDISGVLSPWVVMAFGPGTDNPPDKLSSRISTSKIVN